MSMTVTICLQIFALFVIYGALMLFIPCAFFHGRFADRPITERFMIHVIIGNFYIMNLVFVLELLHISYKFTLLAGTILPPAVIHIFRHRGLLKEKFHRFLMSLHQLSQGTLGIKTFIHNGIVYIKTKIRALFSYLFHMFMQHKTEYLLLTALCVILAMIYGSNCLTNYSYTASDLPVHNYWINELGKNNIFVAGVYPFGYHCVVYYIHMIFDIDTYVILRAFCIIQTLYIHLVLFAFIRGICRSSFAAYTGIFLYAGVNIYNTTCMSRFLSALPQEYGMIFILPCAYFIFDYFCHRKQLLNSTDKKERRVWLTDLALAAMSFSMTIAVHFYDTFVIGIFCIAIVIGFAARFFRPKYMLPLMAAFFIGLSAGVLPMGIAVATGTQMQGSIGWGLSILSSGKTSSSSTQTTTEAQTQETTTIAIPDTDSEEISPDQENLLENADTSDMTLETSDEPATAEADEVTTESFVVHITERVMKIYSELVFAVKINIIRSYGEFFTRLWLAGCAVLIVSGLFMCIFAHFYKNWYDYAFRLISIGTYILMMFAMFIPDELGLPTLMDKNRSRIYIVYMITILYSMLVDIVSCIIGSISKKTTLRNAISFCLTVSVCTAGVLVLGVRSPMYISRNSVLETNGAVTCLSRLLKEHKGQMNWTIVSANDETQMMDGQGYHYETITFLRYLKYADSQQRVTIPTKYVYFYIEKMPLNYTVAYKDSGQYISRAGAAKELPSSGGIDPYKAENRWIVMSKMYYWAESFRKLFPFDMTVYYEDDEFICYQLIQNESSLYNLLIDYNYNQ